jgi:ABC-2 type transport system permease protein
MDSGGIKIRMLESDGTKLAKITDAIKQAMAGMNPASVMDVSYIYGEAKASMFEDLMFVLLGVISFFLIFLYSGVSFIRERTTGTLERFMQTPIRRYQVVLGYTAGFGIFAVIQSVLITLFCQYVLQMKIEGSVVLCIFIMILLAFAAVATGTLVSIFANNEFQVVQFIPIIVIPQIFFSGLIPIDTLPLHLGYLAYGMPIYYGCSALKNVILKGYGISQVWDCLLALLVFIFFLSVINTFALKKYREI